MKQFKTVGSIFAATLLAVGCATQPAPSTAGAKPYPLKTCVFSGDKLGEMGKPIVFVHEGQEIKLCCKDCKKDFDKDPAKYLSQLAGK
jgi:hypothetical protein